MSALRSLERFAGAARRASKGERCELCASDLPDQHRHVVDLADRRLVCSCIACALLFPAGNGRYRAVPTQVRFDAAWMISEQDMQSLGIPVGLVFFFRPSQLGRWTAVFPSPAGATEAELPDDAWAAFAAKSSLVRSIADDVEALLVRRPRSGRTTSLVVPIDVCYELTALLKKTWRGIDGGDVARQAVDSFLTRLEAQGHAA